MKLIDYLKSEYNEYVSNSPVAIFISLFLDDIELGRFEDYPPKNEFEPDYCSPPGDTLKDCIEEMGIGSYKFSVKIGESPIVIRDVLSGYRPIDYKLALKLEDEFGTSAAFWLNREHQYQLCKARLAKQENEK